jgi:exopolysaccharide production protein ExoZ
LSPTGAPLRRLAASIYELPGTGNRFAAVEGLRAYAAFLIFLVHYCDSYATRILGIDPNSLRLSTVSDAWTGVVYYFFASHHGVDIFFFLSGFLICRMLLRPAFNYRGFVLRRIARIYPAFAISLLVWVYVRIAVQRWYSLDMAQLTGNLLFLNAVPAFGVKPFNTVTWSLFFELVFYLTFPLILWRSDRRCRVTPTRIVVFAVLFMPLALQVGAFFIRFLMFFGGAFLAVLTDDTLQRLARRVPDGLAITLYLASTTLFAQLLEYTYFIPVFVVATFFVVLKVTHGEGVLRRVFAWTPLRYLGNVSYSFYLVHGLGVELTMNFYGSAFLGLGGPVYLVATLVTSLVIGLILATGLFVLAEKPYFTWRGVGHVVVTEGVATAGAAASK